MKWQEMSRDEKTAACNKQIWSGAMSAMHMARALDVTKNMVIGHCYRHDITLPNTGRNGRPANPYKARPKRKRKTISITETMTAQQTAAFDTTAKRKAKAKAQRVSPPVPTIPLIPLNGIGVLFTERNMLRQCAWPLWAGKADTDKRCCGHPSLPDRSYCTDHHQISIGDGTPFERRAAIHLRMAAV